MADTNNITGSYNETGIKADSRQEHQKLYYQGMDVRKVMMASIKCRAKKAGIEFNLDVEDFNIPTHCPVLGIELKRGKLRSCKSSSPSVDRIDPNKGYIKGNVWVISQKANCMKNDATLDELKQLVKALENLDVRCDTNTI